MGRRKSFQVGSIRMTSEGNYYGQIKSEDRCTHIYHYNRIGRLLDNMELLGRHGLTVSRKETSTYIVANSGRIVKAVIDFIQVSALDCNLKMPVN